MSTGLECLLFESQPGSWYYLLQDCDCPVGAWDWREYASCTGPFTSEDGAFAHLRAYHANPGGHCSRPFDPARGEDPVLGRHARQAHRPQSNRNW